MAKIMATETETTLLLAIVNSEYHSSRDVVSSPVWSSSVANGSKALAGALSSCVKKGLAGQSGVGRDATCWITPVGMDALKGSPEGLFGLAMEFITSSSIRAWANTVSNRPIIIKMIANAMATGKNDPERLAAYLTVVAMG